MMGVRGALLAAALWAGSGAVSVALAEYRAYELEVIDTVECKIAKREICKRQRITTAMSPNLYVRTHGGPFRLGVQLIATWMCYGDTSFYKAVCPRPAPRRPKYSVGDTIRVKLERHITNGWRGRVELAYYQRGISTNVYGIRFADRRNIYARYFEKDLEKSAEAPAGQPATSGQGAPAQPATAGQGAATGQPSQQAPPGGQPAPAAQPAATAPGAQ